MQEYRPVDDDASAESQDVSPTPVETLVFIGTEYAQNRSGDDAPKSKRKGSAERSVVFDSTRP